MTDKIVITRPIVGICHMQVCAHKSATDEEILAHANAHNSTGLSHGWATVVREASEFWGDMRPVQCDDDPERVHYVLAC